MLDTDRGDDQCAAGTMQRKLAQSTAQAAHEVCRSKAAPGRPTPRAAVGKLCAAGIRRQRRGGQR
jgi:hypothetical protein